MDEPKMKRYWAIVDRTGDAVAILPTGESVTSNTKIGTFFTPNRKGRACPVYESAEEAQRRIDLSVATGMIKQGDLHIAPARFADKDVGGLSR